MPTPTNKALYAKARAKYASMKHSAYKSSLVVKEYKKNGGGYTGDKSKGGLTRWHKVIKRKGTFTALLREYQVRLLLHTAN